MAQWVEQQGSEAVGTSSIPSIYLFFLFYSDSFDLPRIFVSTPIKTDILHRFLIGALGVNC